jgi:hypothetical protein
MSSVQTCILLSKWPLPTMLALVDDNYFTEDDEAIEWIKCVALGFAIMLFTILLSEIMQKSLVGKRFQHYGQILQLQMFFLLAMLHKN